ncbi:TPA: hypothetical protein PXN07_003942 [Yersinia enterocolitica]|nr:hypothetical protein [Yersinia enterocolitica]
MNTTWSFLDNPANESEGLANSGIEIFRDAPISSIARECGQNSIDAAESDDKSVTVTFEKIEVRVNKIPNLDEFHTAIKNCLNKSKNTSDHKAAKFFEKAVMLLNAETIKILKISDSGTKGVEGPCEEGTPYYALLRSSGISQKGNNIAGGSFGIGKNATFAVSQLRTVFYSTNYIEKSSAQEKFLCQGKSLLISHEDDNGNKYRGTGYWGGEGYCPIEADDNLPEWLKVNGVGTSISILGFDDSSCWEEQISETLLRNFFSAINNKKVIFRIGDKYVLDKESITDLFDNKDVANAAELAGYKEEFNFSHSLYRCISSDLSQKESIFVDGLGEFKLSLLVEDKLEKRVGFVRNGMYITNSLENFKDKMKRFYSLKDFVAVIEPVDRQSISILRDLENPQHNTFSPVRYDNKEKESKIKKQFHELTTKAKDFIKSNTTSPPEDEILLDELNIFFEGPSKVDSIPEGNGENAPETVSVKKIKLVVTVSSPDEIITETRGSERKYTKSKEAGNGGRSTVTVAGGQGYDKEQGGGTGPTVEFQELRTKLGKDSANRIIYLTPNSTCEAKIRIATPGLSKVEMLDIVDVKGARKDGTDFIVKLDNNKRMNFDVKFKNDYIGPVLIFLEKLGGAEK